MKKPSEKTAGVAKIFKEFTASNGNVKSFLKRATEIGRIYNFRISRVALYALLRNKFYRGVLTYKGKEYKGAHRPLISKQLFKAVQDILEGCKRVLKLV